MVISDSDRVVGEASGSMCFPDADHKDREGERGSQSQSCRQQNNEARAYCVNFKKKVLRRRSMRQEREREMRGDSCVELYHIAVHRGMLYTPIFDFTSDNQMEGH